MNIKIILIILIFLTASIYFMTDSETSNHKTSESLKIEKSKDVFNPKKKVAEKSVSVRQIHQGIELSIEAEELLFVLEPLTFDALERQWSEQYGCYKYSADQVDKNILLEDECSDQLLNAKSFEEALWMQRQGYPTKTQLQLINDRAHLEALLELANNKVPIAAALVAIAAIRTEQTKSAVLWAAEYGALVSNDNSFQYRLLGEAHMLANSDSLGLAELQMAALLGDSQSENLFYHYANDRPMLIADAINHAHLVMGRIFGVSMEHYPKDPRPKNWGG
ncbi:hypothetical protein [Marinicella sp. W31]|uniref:hypothetical protein n=1 Tax=Marinicella sp. W31 TaxID=3023713 RepID=UPI0037569CC5